MAADRSGWVGTRITVLLTMVVAVLSVVTGIANIGASTALPPFVGFVPESVQRLAGFTGTLTGFLMIASTLGLRRGLRAAWYSTVVLLPVTAGQGVIQSSPVSIPLVALSLVSIPVVVVNRRRFDREISLSTTQMAAGTALVGVQLYGTVGSYALREEFAGIDTATDAFYYTIVTASTVGYGDATPTSQVARLYGMSVVVLGTASFAIALGALLGPAIEARLSRALGRMTDAQLELLENHVLVLGYGDLTEPILSELSEGEVPFVVITPDPNRAAELSDRGFDVVTADPSDEEPMLRARIADARAVVAATNNDAEDALAVLTARNLRPDVRIVVAATDRENVNKLRRAGADTVISPASIGGHLLVQSALGAEDSEAIADRLVDRQTGATADRSVAEDPLDTGEKEVDDGSGGEGESTDGSGGEGASDRDRDE